MSIGSGVLLPGVVEIPPFPILRPLAYTTGLGYRPTCDYLLHRRLSTDPKIRDPEWLFYVTFCFYQDQTLLIYLYGQRMISMVKAYVEDSRTRPEFFWHGQFNSAIEIYSIPMHVTMGNENLGILTQN